MFAMFLRLTVMVVDVVWDVDVAVGPLSPHAAAGSARVGVPLGFAGDGDVSLHQDRVVKGTDYSRRHACMHVDVTCCVTPAICCD